MKRMALFSIFLPLKDNNGKVFSKSIRNQVVKDLEKRFGGVTIQDNPNFPLKGLWYSEKKNRVVPDDLVLYMVAAADVNEARNYLTRYKKELERIFQQEELLIIEQTIESI